MGTALRDSQMFDILRALANGQELTLLVPGRAATSQQSTERKLRKMVARVRKRVCFKQALF
jgi:hypothetical protein